MGNLLSITTPNSLPPEVVSRIQSTSHFSAHEIHNLYSRFQRLDRDHSGTLSPEELMAIPEFAMNPLAARLLPFIFSIKSYKHGGDDHDDMLSVSRIEERELSFLQFVVMLNCFHPRASRREKLDFAFKVFNSSGDGAINRAELKNLLRAMVGAHLSEIELDSIVTRTIEVCHSNDNCDDLNLIKFEEFSNALEPVDVHSLMTTF